MMISENDQKLIDRVTARRREEFEADRIRVRAGMQEQAARLRAAGYPWPDFGRVTAIEPFDPWDDVTGRVDAHRQQPRGDDDQAAIPPDGWGTIAAATRARLGGLVKVIVERFPHDDARARERSERMHDVISIALLAAATRPDGFDVERRGHSAAAHATFDAFSGLDAAEWLIVRHAVNQHGGTQLLRELAKKLDRPPGILERVIGAFKALIEAAR